jgi:SpoIIAA-like
MQHWRRWERVAIVTEVPWIKSTVWVFRFLIPAEMKVFSTNEAEHARSWITSA